MPGGEQPEGGPESAGGDSAAGAQDTVGDGRQKHVTVYPTSAAPIEHGDVYLRHSADAFVVSPDAEFSPTQTTRYEKADVLRVEVVQHHSSCFITTATANDAKTLDALRGFRDEAMVTTAWGRPLVAVYERISPPIARTLERHPHATTTNLVRSLVGRCGALAEHRDATDKAAVTAFYTVILVVLYVLGVLLAAAGHSVIRVRETLTGE